MRLAIISDIHGNFDALEAVLADIDGRGIREILCLGDIVGYGPEPASCIDLVRERCRLSLMGNHDLALLTEPFGFNRVAAQAIHCHRHKLIDACDDEKKCGLQIDWLKERPRRHEEDGMLFVHASPRDPISEYVLPTDMADGPNEKIREIFEMIDGPCFVGHSHYPGMVSSEFKWLTPEEANGVFVIGQKAVVNDGSVGQPRDRDPRACYVELNEGRVYWHRVEYPFRKTMEKILADGCLHAYSAERLAEGK